MTRHVTKRSSKDEPSRVLANQQVERRQRARQVEITPPVQPEPVIARSSSFRSLFKAKPRKVIQTDEKATIWDFRALNRNNVCSGENSANERDFSFCDTDSEEKMDLSFEEEKRPPIKKNLLAKSFLPTNRIQRGNSKRIKADELAQTTDPLCQNVLQILNQNLSQFMGAIKVASTSILALGGEVFSRKEEAGILIRNLIKGIVKFTAVFSGVVFLGIIQTCKLIKQLSKCFALFCASAIAPLFYVFRMGSVLLLRWLKIYGVHGVPNLSTRKLRALTLVGAFQLATVLIVFRLFALQGSEHLKWEKIASKQQSRDVSETGTRGSIVDRNGLELAVSIPSLSIGAHPKWIKDLDQAVVKISTATGIAEKELRTKLNSEKQFIWLAKGISQSKELELSKLKLFGLELEREYKRVYPQGNLASTIIGKAGADGAGLSGVERALNKQLLAPSVTRSMQRDARGKMLNTQAWDEKEGVALAHLKDIFEGQEARNAETLKEGGGVQLTLDGSIQSILEEEIDLSKVTSKAKHVFGVMMDAHTGEVLAMGQSERSDLSSNKSQSAEELRNIVLQNSFEPGSTFKPVIAALALEHKLTSPNEMINCENGRFPVGKYTIKDAHPVPTVSLEQVLVRSSNIGMTKLGFRIGKDRMYRELKEFGFGESTKVGLSGEASGIFRNASKWANIDIATHSFGQGISVTALQLVRAYAVLANGGYLVRPKLVSDRNIPLESNPKLLSKSTTDFIRGALNQVTENEHGTGKNSRIAGVPVYGKTGTAQKSRTGGTGYDSSKILASFIGFVDGKSVGVNRTLVLYIAVDEPGVWPRWGGTLAAPVFKKVMERTLSHYLLTEPESGARLAKVGANHISGPTL